MAKKVAQMIEEQVQFWRLKNSSKATFPASVKHLPIITVSREFGARGAEIATILGHKLGFKVWDKDLLDVISIKLGSNKEYMQSLDENRRSLLEDTIFGFMNQKGTNLNYFIYLVKAIRSIENIGNSIIVGRGANFICRNSNSFHIRVVSPLEKRVKYYAQKEGISSKNSLEIITKKDSERANFITRNFNKNIDASSNYDLVITSGSFDLDTVAEIISTAYTCKITDKEKVLT
ncbi:MAG: cytidylate kinase-like family protein [Balneolaceae bacterium]